MKSLHKDDNKGNDNDAKIDGMIDNFATCCNSCGIVMNMNYNKEEGEGAMIIVRIV